MKSKSEFSPGIAFERVVAEIQARIDPAATVTHNEKIVDRLGQSRQFDIVIRGVFAGQPMLGVIECKDFGRKVGTPEVDSLVTKASDINANFKILMSRHGFSKPALDKCLHYGIQALSLVENDPANKNFFIGTRWDADIYKWNQISVGLHFVNEPSTPVHFNVEDLRINEKKILDWFTNYLMDNYSETEETGWIVDLTMEFVNPQKIQVAKGIEYLCKAISFMAEHVCERLERLVGISGTGFFDWNSRRATFPANTQIVTDAVPMDFSLWSPRADGVRESTGFIDMRLKAAYAQFVRVPEVIELERL